ncbi:MAG: diaminopimelate epimerase, partial [Mycobacteriales bacterium]
MTSILFAKGHGTGNDFVILPDANAEVDLAPWQVRALCDRRTGIGGDGVIRVVPAAKDPAGVEHAEAAEWFMDYRNADGSLAQMCGNGARVFAWYLVTEGLAPPGSFSIATRDGVKRVHVPAPSGENRTRGSATVEVRLPRLGRSSSVTLGATVLPGTAVDVGNPHVVCVVDAPLAEFDLSTAPDYDRAVFPEGVNVALITAPDAVLLDAATVRADTGLPVT